MKKIIVVSLTTIAFAGCLPQQTEQVDLPIETPQQEEQIEKIGLTNQEVQTTAKYLDYSAENLAASSGKTLIFFHASWCPTCRAADASIVDQLDNIPSGLTILKVDYDKETALKQKYGVRTQHTFVQVDAEGNEIAKWSGSATLASIVAKVQ